jgi:NAD(P)-dependent dehydrogenase (short-subunit alcohol dehydrogenase family)
METLAGKKVVVVGASLGVGRAIVALAHRDGAQVLAVARGADALDRLAADFPGVATMVADATLPETPALVLRAIAPDVLVLSAGAIPPRRSFFELGWDEFSANWNADVKASFLFCKAAIEAPFPRGAAIILISSGAAIGGSPLSGGYAGAKHMQMFLAKYSQREAERLGLDLRFLAIAPGGVMPQTRLGEAAASGYARYLNISPEAFVAGFKGAPTPEDIAGAVIDFASGRKSGAGAYLAKADGVDAIP